MLFRSERKAQLTRASMISVRKRRARKALAPFVQPPALTAPGVTLWAYRPPLRLSLSMFR